MKSTYRKLPLTFALMACVFLLPASQALSAVDGVEPSSVHYWSQIKGDTFDQREHFAKGVASMSERLDSQIGELRSRRSGMKTDTSDWDFAMKEVEDSRAMLTDRINGLSKASTPEAWGEAKDNIHEAWSRSQAAVDKMNATRTS